MKRILSLLLVGFNAIYFSPVFGQFSETIRTGRPGQDIGAYAVGRNVFQVQAGLTSNNYNSQDPTIETTDDEWLQNTVIRYGLTEKLEVSSVLGSQFGNDVLSGINSLQFGFRFNFLDNLGAQPALAVQARTLLPVGTGSLERDELGTQVIVATANSLITNLSLITNAGLTVSNNMKPIKFYTINLSYTFFDRLGVFVEAYDNFRNFNNSSIDFDTGIGFLITNDLYIDVSTGWQDNPDTEARNSFIDFGVSFRIHNRDQ